VLQGNGEGTFTRAALLTTGNHPWSLGTGDFNGHGRPDLAVANSRDGSVSILVGSGNLVFGPAKTVTVSARRQLISLLAADCKSGR
jgi:hypothetical protein